MKFLWPQHNYLGPGNPSFNGEPVDEADRIAQAHDFNYATSFSKQDIFKSDQVAINQFKESYNSGDGGLAALAGETGLSIKHLFESTLNRTIYPWNLPDESSMNLPPQKIRKIGNTKTVSDPTVGERQASHSHNFDYTPGSIYEPFFDSDNTNDSMASGADDSNVAMDPSNIAMSDQPMEGVSNGKAGQSSAHGQTAS